jgi:molecular chaperone DnaK
MKSDDTDKIKADTEALQKPLYELSAELYKQNQGAAQGAAGAAGANANAGAGAGAEQKKSDDDVVDAEVVDDDKK